MDGIFLKFHSIKNIFFQPFQTRVHLYFNASRYLKAYFIEIKGRTNLKLVKRITLDFDPWGLTHNVMGSELTITLLWAVMFCRLQGISPLEDENASIFSISRLTTFQWMWSQYCSNSCSFKTYIRYYAAYTFIKNVESFRPFV